MILDLFAGPGGWDEGARMLGITDTLGLESDRDACSTAQAAGHQRVCGDLSLASTDAHGPFDGLIASPPCQGWSTAGKQRGRFDRVRVIENLQAIRRAGRWVTHSRVGWHDPRSPLVLEPLRYVLEGQPEWVAFEQVPPVLSLWVMIAEILGDHGYSTVTGIVSAEQYGVPQTRKRAILLARRGPGITLPQPTHQKYVKHKLFDPDSPLLHWVSMAQALGWGMTDRPYLTVASGRGGADPAMLGGSGARQALYDHRELGEWLQRSNYSASGRPGMTAAERGLAIRHPSDPSMTVTGKPPSWVYRSGTMPNAAIRELDHPAPTVLFGHNSKKVTWTPTAMLARQMGATARPIDEPAATITSSGMAKGVTVWTGTLGPYKPFGDDESIRVSVEEASLLQSFRARYPWHGTRTKKYEQIGNAIPPILASALLGHLLGKPWHHISGVYQNPAALAMFHSVHGISVLKSFQYPVG